MDRILIRNGSEVKEVSHLLNKFSAGEYTTSITGNTEIYIGKMLPFNHFYINASVKNEIDSEMFIEYWDGSQFRSVANMIDETNGIKSNGFVNWTPNKDYNWASEDTTEIVELEDVTYYDMFWCRISFSVSLTPDMVLNYIGQMFCTDDELYTEFPQFSEEDWLDGFETNKTDWTAQCILASDILAKKMRVQDRYQTRDQILDRMGVRDATVQKVAELVFTRFGQGRVEEAQAASVESSIRLKNAFPKIDKDGDAIYNRKELNKVIHWSR